MDKKQLAEKTFHAVEYAGFFHIQTENAYGGLDILNADNVGYENAKNFAERIASFLNGEQAASSSIIAAKPVWISELERRQQLIISEPDGVVRETMLANLLIDL